MSDTSAKVRRYTGDEARAILEIEQATGGGSPMFRLVTSLAHSIEALEVERDEARAALRRALLTLAAEQGRTHDEDGEPYPWTRAGWKPEGRVVEWHISPPGPSFAHVGPREWFGSADVNENGVQGAPRTGALDGMVQAAAALGLPPMEGL